MKSIDNLEVKNEVLEILNDKTQIDRVWLTVIALWIMKERFDEKEDEWTMIARKSKNYLKKLGINRVDSLFKKLNLEII